MDVTGRRPIGHPRIRSRAYEPVTATWRPHAARDIRRLRRIAADRTRTAEHAVRGIDRIGHTAQPSPNHVAQHQSYIGRSSLPGWLLTLISGNLGCAVLGIAIASTLLDKRGPRIILAIVLTAGCALLYSPATSKIIITVYLAAVALWWIRQILSIGFDALPQAVRQRLAALAPR
jgi:hypothetical protein